MIVEKDQFLDTQKQKNTATSLLSGSKDAFLNSIDMQNAPHKILPKIEIIKKDVYCNGILIKMSSRKLSLALFKVFLESKKDFLGRDDIMRAVYSEDISQKSLRYYDSSCHNIVKLMSRARAQANEAINQDGNVWIDFFPYYPHRKQWSFYCLSNKYLLAKERAIFAPLNQDTSYLSGMTS